MLWQTEKVALVDDSKKAITRDRSVAADQLNVEEFIRIQREMMADLEKEFAQAGEGEKQQMSACISELESRFLILSLLWMRHAHE